MNRGGDSILSVYSDARAEYTKQLCIFLVPAYFQFFIDLLERSKQETTQDPKRTLWQFQTHLNDIHEWNMERVSQEIQRIHSNSGCDYLEDLLTAVFIAHTKVLTAIRLGQHQKKVEINIPKVEHFLFKALCETAKLLWGSTYLFRDGISSIEKQQNYRAIEGMLNEGILQAVRTLVPVKSILKDFVHQDTAKESAKGGEQEEDEDSDDESPVSDPALVPAPVPVPVVSSIPSPVPPVSALACPVSDPVPVPPVSLEGPSGLDLPLPPLEPLDPLPGIPSIPEVPSAPPVSSEPPQLIVLDEKPSVRFGQFDAVFDSDHPTDSDMIYDPKESETEESHDLEIMEENGLPLGDDDFDTMDGAVSGPIDMEDYEEL
jgi:Family of unknown function (DUF5764)